MSAKRGENNVPHKISWHGLTFTQDREIQSAVRAYIPFYNGTRLHSSLNYVPPAAYERQLA